MPSASAPVVNDPSQHDVRSRTAWLAVGILVLVSFGIRLWVLESAIGSGTFAAVDADSYLKNARLLARDGEAWRWTTRAIEYPWAGHMYYLPPLYPLFLSLFVLLFDAHVYWAAVGQAGLNALSVAGLYVIASSIHSRRAGLIAAFIYAFWLTSIWRYALFIQEQLYLPLLILSFALLVRATTSKASASAFVWAGAAFGLATLTRSMPLYFIFPAALIYVLTVRDHASVRRAMALLGGFLAVTGAYSLFISLRLGRFMFIENHAGISIELYGAKVEEVPGFGDIVFQLGGAMWRDPEAFSTTWWGYVRALFHVPGDRWLHAYLATDVRGAAIAKAIAHAGIDVPFVICAMLAPFGVVLARRRREAALLALWVAIVVVLTALSATGGVRYRSPFEPSLIALAAVVLAGGWRRPPASLLVAGVGATAIVGSLVLPQVPRVAVARANYGLIGWKSAEVSWSGTAQGTAGFNLLPNAFGLLEMTLSPAGGQSTPTEVDIRVDGYPIAQRTLDAQPVTVRLAPRHRGFHFVEITATDRSGRPASTGIEVRR